MYTCICFMTCSHLSMCVSLCDTHLLTSEVKWLPGLKGGGGQYACRRIWFPGGALPPPPPVFATYNIVCQMLWPYNNICILLFPIHNPQGLNDLDADLTPVTIRGDSEVWRHHHCSSPPVLVIIFALTVLGTHLQLYVLYVVLSTHKLYGVYKIFLTLWS